MRIFNELFGEAVRSDEVQIFLKLLEHHYLYIEEKYQIALDLHGKLNITKYLIETKKADPNFYKPPTYPREFLKADYESRFYDRALYFFRLDGVVHCFLDPQEYCDYVASNYCPFPESSIETIFDRNGILMILIVEDHEHAFYVKHHGHRFDGSDLVKVFLYDFGGITNTNVFRFFYNGHQNIIYPDGYAALHCAARFGNFMAVKFLYEKMGDSLYIRSNLGTTPLHEAVIGGNTEIIEYLCEKIGFVDFEDNNGWTPLHFSAALGYKEATEILIKKGADLNAKTFDTFLTPLELAEKNLNLEIVKLIQRDQICKKNNIFEESMKFDQIHCCTYLHLAAKKGDTKTIEYYYEKMNFVDFRNHNGWTPLHFAAKKGHIKVVRSLIQKGADLNAKSLDFLTPLQLIDGYFFDPKKVETSNASRLSDNIFMNIFKFTLQMPQFFSQFLNAQSEKESYNNYQYDMNYHFPSQLMLFIVFKHWVTSFFQKTENVTELEDILSKEELLETKKSLIEFLKNIEEQVPNLQKEQVSGVNFTLKTYREAIEDLSGNRQEIIDLSEDIKHFSKEIEEEVGFDCSDSKEHSSISNFSALFSTAKQIIQSNSSNYFALRR